MTEGSADFKLIKAARLIDGTGAPPLERGAVLIEAGRIRAVGTEEAVVPPEGARVQEFNYEEKSVLPGLVDCHVHLNGMGDGRAGDDLTLLPNEVLTLQSARNARAHLYSGVTTVRDCGAKNRTTFMLRQAVDMGITPGPRLVPSGRPVANIGGHLSYFGIQATGEVECRAAVRQLVKEGADFIKITATAGSTKTSVRFRPSFTVEELNAICDEAHKFGKHAAAHCSSSQGMLNALDAGIDTVIHAFHQEPDGVSRYRPEITERIVKQGAFVNATLYQGQTNIDRMGTSARVRRAGGGRATRARHAKGGARSPPQARRHDEGRGREARVRLRLLLVCLPYGQLSGRDRGPPKGRHVAHGGHCLCNRRLRALLLDRRPGGHP